MIEVNYDALSSLKLAFSYYALVGPFTARQRVFLFVGFFLSQTASDGIKELTNRIPQLKKVTRRPVDGAFCDLLSQKPCKANSPGFPSGHMTVTTFFILALIRGEMRKKGISFRKYTENHRWELTIHGLVWTGMALARTQKGCHSWIQVFAGSILGAIVYLLMERVAYSQGWL